VHSGRLSAHWLVPQSWLLFIMSSPGLMSARLAEKASPRGVHPHHACRSQQPTTCTPDYNHALPCGDISTLALLLMWFLQAYASRGSGHLSRHLSNTVKCGVPCSALSRQQLRSSEVQDRRRTPQGRVGSTCPHTDVRTQFASLIAQTECLEFVSA